MGHRADGPALMPSASAFGSAASIELRVKTITTAARLTIVHKAGRARRYDPRNSSVTVCGERRQLVLLRSCGNAAYVQRHVAGHSCEVRWIQMRRIPQFAGARNIVGVEEANGNIRLYREVDVLRNILWETSGQPRSEQPPPHCPSCRITGRQSCPAELGSKFASVVGRRAGQR